MVTVPQRFVTVDDRRVHLLDVGAGPSVVLETGAGGSAVAWLPLMRKFSGARLVAVDRPGAGWSDAGPQVHPADVAGRLRKALLAADVPPPYLLVGHSLGGFHVRVFAAMFPAETRGLLLLDPSHEDMESVLEAASVIRRWVASSLDASLAFTSRLPAPLGNAILGPLIAPPRVLRLLGGDRSETQRIRRVACSRASVRAAIRERRSVPTSCAALRALDDNVDVPLRLLSASSLDRSGQRHELRQRFNALHADLAHKWSDGVHEVVPETTHLFPIERPEVVGEQIASLLGIADLIA